MSISKERVEDFITHISKETIIDTDGISHTEFCFLGDGYDDDTEVGAFSAHEETVEEYIAFLEEQRALAFEYLDNLHHFSSTRENARKSFDEKKELDRILNESFGSDSDDVIFEETDVVAGSDVKTYNTTYYSKPARKETIKETEDFHAYVDETTIDMSECCAENIDDGFNEEYQADDDLKAYGHWRSENKKHNTASTEIKQTATATNDQSHNKTFYSEMSPANKDYENLISEMTDEEFHAYIMTADVNSLTSAEYNRMTDAEFDLIVQRAEDAMNEDFRLALLNDGIQTGKENVVTNMQPPLPFVEKKDETTDWNVQNSLTLAPL